MRHAWAPTETAVLLIGVTVALISGVLAYRTAGPYGERNRADARVMRFVDPATGSTWLVFDADGDGRFDTRCLMEGDRVVRTEIDDDGDGRIDRRHDGYEEGLEQ